MDEKEFASSILLLWFVSRSPVDRHSFYFPLLNSHLSSSFFFLLLSSSFFFFLLISSSFFLFPLLSSLFLFAVNHIVEKITRTIKFTARRSDVRGNHMKPARKY